jgi:hypothetical protein
MDLVTSWEAAGNPGAGLGLWLLTLGGIFLVVLVSLLVYVCMRGSPWDEDAAPGVRWVQGMRVKAFATATAAGDFVLAERIAAELMDG